MTFRTSKISNQLKTNMVLYLNNLLLNEGYYNNIALGEFDFEGNDLSQLALHTDDSTFSLGTVWQSHKLNWVYEGDVVVPSGALAPVDPSGVYIDDVFFAKDDATFGHVFDFENGRVVFTSGVGPTVSNTVQVEYSYKEVFVGIANKTTVHALHNDFFDDDSVFNSVFPSGVTSTPAIWIDVEGQTISPLALGGGKIVNKLVHFHVISNDDGLDEIDDIADVISFQQYRNTRLVDIDKMPELFDFRGARATGYQDYTVMVADNSLFWKLISWMRADRVDVTSERLDWNRVRMDIMFELRDISI